MQYYFVYLVWDKSLNVAQILAHVKKTLKKMTPACRNQTYIWIHMMAAVAAKSERELQLEYRPLKLRI